MTEEEFHASQESTTRKRTGMSVDELLGKPENGHGTEPEAKPEDIAKPDWSAEDPTTGLPIPNAAPEPPTATPPEKPAKPEKDGVGPKSSAWERLNGYKERLGQRAHAIIVETKEQLGWPNTPIHALSTQQIITICNAIDAEHGIPEDATK